MLPDRNDRNNHVCPVERAGLLDHRIRRWLQDPRKILGPYIEEGMTVLDIGCGPGFFSLDLAHMVGRSGRVIASDLQEGMIEKLRNKIRGTELEERITLHQCEADKVGVSGKVDFVLAFYMVHEVPNPKKFFEEIKSVLKLDGQMLIVEPPFRVSKKAFQETIQKARDAGLKPAEGPKVPLSKSVILRNG